LKKGKRVFNDEKKEVARLLGRQESVVRFGFWGVR
jgi:hypothetical protein